LAFSLVGFVVTPTGVNWSFVQCADVVLAGDGNPAAPGGAVTMVLCGRWDHEGECCWPHQTLVAREENRGEVRVVFSADDREETRVRGLIDAALAVGASTGPDGRVSHWTAAEQRAGVLLESETDCFPGA